MASAFVRAECVLRTAAFVQSHFAWSEEELHQRLSPGTRRALATSEPDDDCAVEHHGELLRVLASTAGQEAQQALVACGRAVTRASSGPLVKLAHDAMTPRLLVRRFPQLFALNQRGGERVDVLTLDPGLGRATVRVAGLAGYSHFPLYLQGWLEQAFAQIGRDHLDVTMQGNDGPAPEAVTFELAWEPVAAGAAGDDVVRESVVETLLTLAAVSFGRQAEPLKTGVFLPGRMGLLFSRASDLVLAMGAEQEQSAAFRRELNEKLAMVEEQRVAIRALSTPVIEVWEEVLCLPLVGLMDSTRSNEVMEKLLAAIVEKKARTIIIDITGIDVMDTRTADDFLRLSQAVRLLGADCVLTGISPAIAQTIVHLGVDLSSLATHRSLRGALQHLLRVRARTSGLRPRVSAGRARDGGRTGGQRRGG